MPSVIVLIATLLWERCVTCVETEWMVPGDGVKNSTYLRSIQTRTAISKVPANSLTE